MRRLWGRWGLWLVPFALRALFTHFSFLSLLRNGLNFILHFLNHAFALRKGLNGQLSLHIDRDLNPRILPHFPMRALEIMIAPVDFPDPVLVKA